MSTAFFIRDGKFLRGLGYPELNYDIHANAWSVRDFDLERPEHHWCMAPTAIPVTMQVPF